MAWTQEQVDALKAKIARAEKSISYGDKRVDYAELKDMISLLKMMESSIASAAEKTTPSRTVLIKHARGV